MTPLLIALIVTALAAHRVARTVAVDDIGARPRNWVAERAYLWPDLPPGARDHLDALLANRNEDLTPRVKSRPWAWAYGGMSCPHCCGFWFSVGIFALWWNVDRSHAFVAAVAASGLQSVVSARGMA